MFFFLDEISFLTDVLDVVLQRSIQCRHKGTMKLFLFSELYLPRYSQRAVAASRSKKYVRRQGRIYAELLPCV